MTLKAHGFEVISPREMDLSNYICAIDTQGRQIAVAHSGFAHPGPLTKPIIKPDEPSERSTVHGHESGPVADFDACMAKYPEIEGYVGFTASYGGNYENALVMIAPVEEIRKPGVAYSGGQFTLGRHTTDRIKWDFRQSAPTIPGSMMATISTEISTGPPRKRT